MFGGIALLSMARNNSFIADAFEVCDDTGECCSQPWKAVFAGNVLVISLVLMVQDVRADFVLITATVLCGSVGILTPGQAFGGFAAGGNILIQVIFILVKGVQDSGVLDLIFTRLLGRPRLQCTALLRCQAISAALSAFLQQNTVAMAGASCLAIWGPQVRLTARELLMPFVASGGMGGNLLLVSSSVSLTVAALMPDAKLRMLDPAPVTLILTVASCIYGTTCSVPLLRSSSAGAGTVIEMARVITTDIAGDCFTIDMEVCAESLLLGRSPRQAGLIMAEVTLSDESLADEPIAAGGVLRFVATAAGIAKLRRQAVGLSIRNPDRRDPLDTLGAGRHRRRLYEVGVGGKFVGCDFPPIVPQAHCLAVRRPGVAACTGQLEAGDVLLVEAFEDFADQFDLRHELAFVSLVPCSSPPRHGRKVDTLRGWLASMLLLIVFTLAVLNIGEIAFLGMCALIVAVLLNIVRRNTLLQSLNLQIYLVIAGGLGLSQAMSRSGLAHAVAIVVVSAGEAAAFGSPVGILLALSIVSQILANLMSNTATIAMMSPIAVQACTQRHINQKTAALVLLYSCNAAFSTPFATSANLIIKDFGQYTFKDYLRFGMPLQLISTVLITLCTVLIFGIDE